MRQELGEWYWRGEIGIKVAEINRLRAEIERLTAEREVMRKNRMDEAEGLRAECERLRANYIPEDCDLYKETSAVLSETEIAALCGGKKAAARLRR